MQNQIFINIIKEMELIDIDWISYAFLHITHITFFAYSMFFIYLNFT